jgi:hypothetical protein
MIMQPLTILASTLAASLPVGPLEVPEAKASMSVIGYDRTRALEAGATISTERGGVESVTLPSGDTLRFIDGEPVDSMRGTVSGNCGTSNVYGNRTTRKYSSAYTISGSKGRPVSHHWAITVSSANAVRAYNRNGMANPLVSSSWSTGWSSISQTGAIKSMMASGDVLTTYGVICGSGIPTWK